MTLPLVAIVGRANVGKSTLFNRLMGENRAIVDDTPGTTRDRIVADIQWRGFAFSLVDTGGLHHKPLDEILHQVRDHAEIAIGEADSIIFMVDVMDGLLPDDEEIAEMLRRSGKPVVLAANKADTARRELGALEFHQLALGEPVPISAYHDIGITQLMEQVTALLPPTLQTPEAQGLKVAIVGRPNVGKSMLVNAILGEERAIVSPTPGTTRDATDTPFSYDGTPMVLIDTAGLRRRGRIERGIEQYSVLRAIRAIQRADVAVLVTDAQDGITAQDAHIAGYAKESFKGVVISINKWDLAAEMEVYRDQYAYEARKKLRFLSYAPIHFISAKLKQGIDELMASVRRIGEERNLRVQTSLLNSVLHRAFLTHSPASTTRKRLNFYYATQAEINPPTFVFFVNDPSIVHFSYRRYLENRLRDSFGFHGTPLRLIFRARGER